MGLTTKYISNRADFLKENTRRKVDVNTVLFSVFLKISEKHIEETFKQLNEVLNKDTNNNALQTTISELYQSVNEGIADYRKKSSAYTNTREAKSVDQKREEELLPDDIKKKKEAENKRIDQAQITLLGEGYTIICMAMGVLEDLLSCYTPALELVQVKDNIENLLQEKVYTN